MKSFSKNCLPVFLKTHYFTYLPNLLHYFFVYRQNSNKRFNKIFYYYFLWILCIQKDSLEWFLISSRRHSIQEMYIIFFEVLNEKCLRRWRLLRNWLIDGSVVQMNLRLCTFGLGCIWRGWGMVGVPWKLIFK